MKLRFEQTLAGPSESYPLGLVLDVDRLTPEQERWVRAGIVSVVRDPDAGIEQPEPPDRLERAGAVAGPVPRLCPGGVAICLGGGPSLTAADVAACRGHGTVIAINDAYRLAPWADLLYACDDKWWHWHHGVPDFPGRKFALEPWRSATRFPDVTILKHTGVKGLELTGGALRTGKNSGYQAINLAVHLGAVRILLLGYDLQYGAKGQSHWFGEHPDGAQPPVQTFVPYFTTLVAPLAARGIEVINCSRQTALTCFPQQALETALAAGRSAAVV